MVVPTEAFHHVSEIPPNPGKTTGAIESPFILSADQSLSLDLLISVIRCKYSVVVLCFWLR